MVACFWLPIGLASFTPPTGNSVVLFVPMLLLVSVGPVILAVSAQAPLMQQWFAAGSDRNPYPLYSASNLGSFAGLLAYPFVVEPLLRLDTQRWGWSACYGVLIVLVAGCGVAAVRAVRVGGSRTEARQVVRGVVPRRRIGLWIVLSAVPSGLMLSTTTHLSTDIMAMPLLWAIPLGLYLLSFSVAFAERRAASRFITKAAPVVLLLGGATSLTASGTTDLLVAAGSVLMLFVVAVAVHSRLYDSRPDTGNLTLFYLTTSVGGAIGGALCGLVAPVAFDWVYEHPILIFASAALLPLGAIARVADLSSLSAKVAGNVWRVALVTVLAASVGLYFAPDGPLRLATIAVLAVVAVLTLAWRSVYVLVLAGLMLGLGAQGTVLSIADGQRSRSYFGVYTVYDDANFDARHAGPRQHLARSRAHHARPGAGAHDVLHRDLGRRPRPVGGAAALRRGRLGRRRRPRRRDPRLLRATRPDVAVLRDRPAGRADRAGLGQLPLPVSVHAGRADHHRRCAARARDGRGRQLRRARRRRLLLRRHPDAPDDPRGLRRLRPRRPAGRRRDGAHHQPLHQPRAGARRAGP